MVVGRIKIADDPTAAVRAQAAASPLPQVTIPTTAAPAGKKGPIGTAPRTNYSRVNTGVPSVPDAGSSEQKSLSPKLGSPMNGISTSSRPTLQTMLKTAQAGALGRAKVAQEAQRQLSQLEGTKTGEEMCEGCKKPKGECKCKEKTGSATITTSYAEKVASALEFLAAEVQEEEKAAAPNAPPAHMTETVQMPGKGPGALEVTQATASKTLPDHHGQGKEIVPMTPGTEKVLKAEHGGTALETNDKHAPGGSAKTPEQVVPKHGSAELYASNLARMGIKTAEDAINPAHISAGPAVPPDTSEAGQPGGEPAGGAPQGPTGLVSSNQGAINYTKGQAKAPGDIDLKKWFAEPAMKNDSTLQDVFDSTGKAGVKISSAEGDEKQEAVKTAAARALLENLFEPKV